MLAWTPNKLQFWAIFQQRVPPRAVSLPHDEPRLVHAHRRGIVDVFHAKLLEVLSTWILECFRVGEEDVLRVPRLVCAPLRRGQLEVVIFYVLDHL